MTPECRSSSTRALKPTTLKSSPSCRGQQAAYGHWVSAKQKSTKSLSAPCHLRETTDPRGDYIKITKTYALEAAKAFRTLPPPNQPFHFVYVSGTGATTQPGFFTSLFARVKGETELELAELRRATPLFRASSVRPAFIDHAHHEAIKKYVPPRPTYETLFRPLAPVFRAAMPGLCSPTEQLGRFLTEMAMGRHEDRLVGGKDVQMVGEMPILENMAFRRLAGLRL